MPAASTRQTVAARKTLAWLNGSGEAKRFIGTAQRLIYLKGTDAHDYKFSSAVLEDYGHLSPKLRDRFLAARVFWLKGSGSPDRNLVARTRARFDSTVRESVARSKYGTMEERSELRDALRNQM